MYKAIFHDGDDETILEIPEHLMIISDLTEELSSIELNNGPLNESDDNPTTKGYNYLVHEITKIYCEHIQIETNECYCEFLKLSPYDMLNSLSMSVLVSNYTKE